MLNSNINVLEKINAVHYKGKLLNQEEIESFFNRRKRSMIFFVDNSEISKIEPCNYGYIDIFYKNGKTKKIYGKIVSYEKSKYDDSFYIGLEIGNEKDINENNLMRSQLTEAIIFLNRVNSFKNRETRLNLSLFHNNQDDIVKIPVMDITEHIIYSKLVSREEFLK